jgi:hypothetical protein
MNMLFFCKAIIAEKELFVILALFDIAVVNSFRLPAAIANHVDVVV